MILICVLTASSKDYKTQQHIPYNFRLTSLYFYFIITVMPKIVNHQKRKQAFTQATKEVIAQKGLNSVRLIDVAKSIGATTGSLGHYFSDKEDLLDSTLRELIHDWESRLSSEGTLLDVLLQYLPMDQLRQRDLRVWVAFYNRFAPDRYG